MNWNKKIVKYYDYTLPFYKKFWYKDSDSYAIHYGLWESDTKTLDEALINTNKFLAKIVGIKSSNIILDAGCGVGGSSIWIAKNFGAHVVGITLSKKQVETANNLALSKKVDHLVKFYVRDFLDTKFPNSSFDIVWAIESVCHAENKKDFLKESYRLLKHGGKIIVADGFLKRPAQNDKERQIIKDFCDGLALPNLEKIDTFKKSLKEVGFTNIKFWDKTKETLPSSKKLCRMCRIAYPISKVAEKLKITSNILTKNCLAGIVQYEAVKIKLLGYGIFYAEK